MNVHTLASSIFLFALLLAVSASAEDEAGKGPSQCACPTVGDQAVVDLLKPIREKHRVPAIAGLVLTSKGIDCCGAVGVRKWGTDVAVTLDDKWHLGSCAKAMTAALAGVAVEQGLLRWDMTVADVFPELAPRFDPMAKDITLLHLLSHRAGLPANLAWVNIAIKGLVIDPRLEAVRLGLSKKPEFPPGTKFQYSNLGYVIAGAMLEKVMKMPWEKAIEEKVFKPLHMESVGFGGTGTPGEVDEPWGHTASETPVEVNGPWADNAPVMSPAGRVHCPIRDWAKFVSDQLRGARGERGLLEKSTYGVLLKPPFGGDYALGWIACQRDWGGGTVFNHSGSNSMHFANVWMAPKIDMAILVCINQGGDTAAVAADEAVTALLVLQSKRREKKGDDRGP